MQIIQSNSKFVFVGATFNSDFRNPVKILARTKSEKDKTADIRRIEEKLKFKKGPMVNVTREKNKLKNSGIKINPIGIKILKLSSNVKEFVIQYIPLR